MSDELAGIGVVGVVGAGTMGAGIAQLALEHGHEVVLHDVDEVAIERGRRRIRDGLDRRARRLDLDPELRDEWVAQRLAGLRQAETLGGLADETDLVIEAAIEDLGLKQEIFRALDAAAGPEVILATNTSALSVSAVAEAATRPARVLGLHFFNPAPVMRLVEVVATRSTAADVADRASALVSAWGRTPVRSADAPGFIVNRVNRPYTIEALRMLEGEEAGVEAIDRALRADGFPMGPFRLMDLAGLDVNLAAARGVWEGLGRPERLRPSPVQERLVAEGRLGRKAGLGFYDYRGDSPVVVDDFRHARGELDPAAIRERILLAVVNEAWHAVADGVATPDDIDLALRLGAAHPLGPLARTAQLGGGAVVRRRLEALGQRDLAPALSREPQ